MGPHPHKAKQNGEKFGAGGLSANYQRIQQSSQRIQRSFQRIQRSSWCIQRTLGFSTAIYNCLNVVQKRDVRNADKSVDLVNENKYLWNHPPHIVENLPQIVIFWSDLASFSIMQLLHQ